MNIAQPRLPPFMTVADFIDWPGDGVGTRYELIDGVLRAMAPGSDAHNTIVSNLCVLLAVGLKKSRPGCRVVAAPGVQPNVRANWNFRIPDLGITCAANKQGDVMMLAPVLLAEVLSPGNAQDTYENVRAYATLQTVLEILVVHSTSIKCELLRRDASGAWPPNPVMIEAGGIVELETPGSRIAIEDIYAGTHLVQPDA